MIPGAGSPSDICLMATIDSSPGRGQARILYACDQIAGAPGAFVILSAAYRSHLEAMNLDARTFRSSSPGAAARADAARMR